MKHSVIDTDTRNDDAIMRKNFGCSHLTIGKDLAGVSDYYESIAAKKIFNEYPGLDIEPVFFPAFYYCKKCRGYSSAKMSPYDSEE